MKVADFITGGDDDHEGELWVVALGTNDVNQYGSPDELAVAVDEMLDAVPTTCRWCGSTRTTATNSRARRWSTPSSPTGSPAGATRDGPVE